MRLPLPLAQSSQGQQWKTRCSNNPQRGRLRCTFGVGTNFTRLASACLKGVMTHRTVVAVFAPKPNAEYVKDSILDEIQDVVVCTPSGDKLIVAEY